MNRLHALDGVRAFAMILVVAAHASLSFVETPIGWAIQDRSRHEAVGLLVWIARAFLMPAFFWASGFFARAAVERGGLGGFARQRLQRVLLPLAILLVPNSLAVTTMWDWARALEGGRAGVAAQLPALRASELPITLAHLWYLYYLLVVSAAAAIAVAIARRVAPAPRALPRGDLALVYVALPCVAILAAEGKLQLDTALSFLVDPSIAAYHALFFAWGFWVHANPDDLTLLARRAPVYAAAAFALLVAIVPALRAGAASSDARAPLGAIVASALFSCLTTAAFLGACARWLTRPRPWLRFVSDASYWCYLVHLPLVVLLQIALAHLAWPGPIKAAAILACTFGACLVTYRLLVRPTALARVF